LGGGDAAEILPPLSRAAPFIRRRVSEMVQLKYAPELIFEADKTFDYAARIDAVLQSVGLGAAAATDEEHGP
jgi:ribosome-binding factor A